VTLEELNALDRPTAVARLVQCCGSRTWADAMAAARPFPDTGALQRAADAIWSSLDPQDWCEAFSAHPRIGASGPGMSAWSTDEQSGVGESDRARFSALNRAYEERFGHIFIVCAAGRSAGDLLSALERRLQQQAEEELHEAAEEQRKITRLRLARLIT
jgi:OHCU decarboxylase